MWDDMGRRARRPLSAREPRTKGRQVRQRRRSTSVAFLTLRRAVRSLRSLPLLIAVLAAFVAVVSPPASQAVVRGTRAALAVSTAPGVGVPVVPRPGGLRYAAGRLHVAGSSAGTDSGGSRPSSRSAPQHADRLTTHHAGPQFALTPCVGVPAPAAAAGRPRHVAGGRPVGVTVVPASGRSPPAVAGLSRRQQTRSDHLDT